MFTTLFPWLLALLSAWYGPSPRPSLDLDLLSLTVRDLQQYLSNGSVTSVQLVEQYLVCVFRVELADETNIEANDYKGLGLRAVLETAPRDNVLAIAKQMDDLRASGTILSELHGIPLLFKDNIDTDVSLGMNTTAGSYAFLESQVPGDAFVTAKLRAAGVIVLGKANMGELAEGKGNVPSGWSARGGQTQSAYVEGGNPCGSSSGSAVGVSAGFAPASLGTDTDGSLTCPASRAALYTIRSTVGLVSQTGVIPEASSMDVVGPMAKSTYDVALILENMVGHNPEDSLTHGTEGRPNNYTQFALDPLYNAKLAVPRWFYNATALKDTIPGIIPAMEDALRRLESHGATIVDPAEMPSATDLPKARRNKDIQIYQDMKLDVEVYLKRRINTSIHTMEDLINWNDAHHELEFEECCQEFLIQSVQYGPRGQAYQDILASHDDIARKRGIDYTLDKYGADAIVVPAESWGIQIASIAGYPMATVPLGQLDNGRPYGMSFIGRKWSEPMLIRLMAAWEEMSPPRPVPKGLA